jgi:hypothetical protein
MSGELVFVGDSITQHWVLPWPNSVNGGINGQDSAAILARMDALIAAYPDAALFHILAGTNDLTTGWAAAIDNIEAMADKCLDAGVPFVLCKVPARPWVMNGLNDGIAALCMARGFSPPIDYYTPFQLPSEDSNTYFLSDGTHPNTIGYAVMKTVADPVICNKLAPKLSCSQLAAIL